MSYQQELKELGKRNVQIKRSFDLEQKGLSLNPYLFEREARVMRKCKQSKISNYQNLYHELFVKSNKRLDKPQQVAETYVLARIYKYLLIKTGKIQTNQNEKDYFTFLAMYQQRLDGQKQSELEDLCYQIHAHEDKILASDQNPDILEQNGYSFSESTFDDLFVKTFQESFIEVSTDSSEEREDDELLEDMEEQKVGGT